MNRGMDDAAQRLKEIIDEDRQDLIQLCLELGNIPSPHAQERALGEAVVGWLTQNGIESYLQWITDESVNAVGVIRGAGGGSSLILNAHMDTGALKKAGVVLRGDLYVTGVAFETGEPSVDDTQGVNFPGEGFGAKWLIDRGVTADYCLVGETSGFGIIMGECGAVWLKIRCKGRELYTPRLVRGESLREHPNPYIKMAHAVMALENWAIGYEHEARFEFPGGTMIPKAQVAAVRGGPGYCDIYYDVRIVPKTDPQAIKREIEAVMETLDFDSEVCGLPVLQGARDTERRHPHRLHRPEPTAMSWAPSLRRRPRPRSACGGT